MFVRESILVGGRPLTLETGRVAKQAHGAVLVSYGNLGSGGPVTSPVATLSPDGAFSRLRSLGGGKWQVDVRDSRPDG